MAIKNLKFRVLTISFFGILSVSQLKAQFQLSGEFRPRTEYRHGYKSMFTEDDKAAFFTSQRTRINAAYSLDKLKLGLSLQDIRVWGDVPQQNNTSNQVMLSQGWAEYLFTKQFSMKIGRQELNLAVAVGKGGIGRSAGQLDAGQIDALGQKIAEGMQGMGLKRHAAAQHPQSGLEHGESQGGEHVQPGGAVTLRRDRALPRPPVQGRAGSRRRRPPPAA